MKIGFPMRSTTPITQGNYIAGEILTIDTLWNAQKSCYTMGKDQMVVIWNGNQIIVTKDGEVKLYG